MTEKDILQGLVGKILRIPDEQFVDLLYQKSEDGQITIREDALNTLSEKFAERITKAKGDSKTLFDNGFKAAEKKVMSDFEMALRTEFEIESELNGVDLVREIVVQKSKAKPLDDDKVKVHPLFLSLEKQTKKQIEEVTKKHQQEIEQIRSTIEREKILSRVKEDAKRITMSLNPILPQNATVASNQMEAFLNQFTSLDYQLADDGNHIPMKEGKRLEDEYGHPITYPEMVKSRAAEWFEFRKQDPKGNGGNGGDGGSGGGIQVPTPKDEQEYLRLMAAAKTPQEQVALYDKFYGSK